MASFNIYYVQSNSKKQVNQSYGFCIPHIVSWCFTFVRNFIIISQKVFNLQSGHEHIVEMAMFKVQKAITPKVGKLELQFICSAHRLLVLYICVKLHENISDGISYGTDTNDGRADGWTLKISDDIT